MKSEHSPERQNLCILFQHYWKLRIAHNLTNEVLFRPNCAHEDFSLLLTHTTDRFSFPFQLEIAPKSITEENVCAMHAQESRGSPLWLQISISPNLNDHFSIQMKSPLSTAPKPFTVGFPSQISNHPKWSPLLPLQKIFHVFYMNYGQVHKKVWQPFIRGKQECAASIL